jgi:hypothetical protein
MTDKQRSFFDDEFDRDMGAKKLARRDDPQTSHAAAAEIVRELGELHQRAMRCVSQRPHSTARELECAFGWEIHKRLKELETLGLVVRGEPRTCAVTGRKAHTWRRST